MISARERTPVLAFKLGIAAHNMKCVAMLCALIGTNQRRWISIARQETEFVLRHSRLFLAHVIDCDRWLRDIDKEEYPDEQSREQQGYCRSVVHRVLGQDLQSQRRR